MKIFLTARLGPFLFIDIFHILGLSSATYKYTCEPLGHLWREISGERTSWGFSGFFRSYCSVVQLCLTLFDPMDCSTPGFLVPWTISRSFLKLRSLSRWCHLISPLLLLPLVFPNGQGLLQWVSFQWDDGFQVTVSHSCRCVSMGDLISVFSLKCFIRRVD